MNVSNQWKDIWWSYPWKCPKNLENLRKTWNLKMRISTKSFYKLFSVVHNYFLWMFLIIERKYVDRIPPKCPKKLRKIAKKRKTWKCEYLLNHSTNFSVWFTTTFYQCFYSLRGYMMIVSLQNVSENLEKLREKENLKMPISTKPFYKLFSTVHNYFLWMCLIIERIYDDRIPPKCSQKLRKFAKNLKPENANIYQVILQTFQCGSQLLSMNVFNHWEEICWSYPSQMS